MKLPGLATADWERLECLEEVGLKPDIQTHSSQRGKPVDVRDQKTRLHAFCAGNRSVFGSQNLPA
jgi:hypothetical protein